MILQHVHSEYVTQTQKVAIDISLWLWPALGLGIGLVNFLSRLSSVSQGRSVQEDNLREGDLLNACE